MEVPLNSKVRIPSQGKHRKSDGGVLPHARDRRAVAFAAVSVGIAMVFGTATADSGPTLLLVPITENGIDGEAACGKFRWVLSEPELFGGGFECWGDLHGVSCVSNFSRGNLNFVYSGSDTWDRVEALFRLSNEEKEIWIDTCNLEPMSASAERLGWLFYEPPADAVALH